MRGLLVALILAVGPQDDTAALLERLADNDPAVREAAAGKLVAGYPSWRKQIEAARDAATDADLKGRLATILVEGRRCQLRTAVAASIPERIRTRFPGFSEALFSPDPETRAGAFRSLKQTFNADPEGNPFHGLYLTPSEMNRLLPHLRAALDPSPDFARARREWVGVLCAHDGLLTRPEWIEAARELLRDPAPGVRDHAIMNLASKIPRPDDIAALIRSWETLDVDSRRRVLHEIATRRLESEYGLLEKELLDPRGGPQAATVILQDRVAPLRHRALDFLKKNPDAFTAMIFDNLSPEEATPIVLEMLRKGTGQTADLLEVLGERGTRDAADAAAAYLTDPDLKIRSAAVKAIGRTGGPKYAPALAQGLREFYRGPDDFDFHGAPAWQALIQWRAGDEIAGLLEFLPRINPYEVDLPGTLGTLRPAGAGAKVGPLVRSPNPYHAGRALEILATLRDSDEARKHLDAIRALFVGRDAPGYSVYHSVCLLGLRELLPLLLDHLDNPFVGWPGRCLALLWSPEERRAALRDPDPKVRSGAVLACAGDDLSLLEPLARDPDGAVRRRLIRALSDNYTAPAGQLLLDLARDGDGAQSAAAAEAYFRQGPREARGNGLAALLRHPSRDIRVRASRYVTRPFARANPELLRTLLEDPETRARIGEAGMAIDPDYFKKRLAVLETEQSARDVLHALIGLETEVSPEEAGIALLRLYERILRPDAPALVSSSESMFGHGTTEYTVQRVLEWAGRIAPKSRGTDLEPVLLKMLASDKPDVREGAADAIGHLGIRAPIPRLVELAGTPEGSRSALALGALKALPEDLLAHADEKVRANAIHAACVSGDPRLFEALLAATPRLADREKLIPAVEALAAMARRDQAGRLLELLKTPNAEMRREVLWRLRRWPIPELVDPAAEFLEDNYFVRGAAAQFLLDAGGARYAERMAVATGEYGASVAAQYGLRGHLGPSLKWLDVPGNPSMDGTAVTVARALADLGMKEHLPAVVAKMKSMRSDERRKMMLETARLGGRDAVAEELRCGEKPEYRLAAAEALFAVGAVEYRNEIRNVAADQAGNATVLIAAMGDRELVERSIREADQRRGTLEIALALGDRFGVEGARARLAERLRDQPEYALRMIRYVWNPPYWKVADREDGWRYRTGRELVEKVRRETGREVAFGTPPVADFEKRFWQGASVDALLHAVPYKASYYIDNRGRIVVDTLDRCVEGWLKR